MILAAPLLIPFAEAAGIAIGTLAGIAGLEKLSNKVEEYIEDNPENAQKIFAMIMPEQGLANILKNESDDGEDIAEVEVETPKLSGKEKGMRIKEAIRRARAGRGNYSSPDAEGSAVDIRGSVIREVEDMGIADKDLKDNYDPNKKKFNYKKYFRKAEGGIVNLATGGTPYDSRATTQDYANALKSVSAGTTYQQQADAKKYARNRANEMLTNAFRSGNQGGLQSLSNQFGFTNSALNPFERDGNRIYGLSQNNRDRVLDQMSNQMLSTTSYGGSGGGAPRQKSALELKIEENKRLYDEYTKNNPATIDPAAALGAKGLMQTAQLNTGASTSIPEPAYMNKDLLSQLTMLTPEEAYGGETFDTLSDLDQYNFAQAFTQLQPQLRDSSYVSPYGPPGDQQIFNRRYGIRDGGMAGNKTYHQVRDQFMPMDSESMGYANGGGIGSMMKPKSKTGKAVNQLQAKAPEGEFLAYINPDEAAMLKRAGGSGEPVNGIPSFRPQDMGNEANQAASAAAGSGSSSSGGHRGPAELGLTTRAPPGPPSGNDEKTTIFQKIKNNPIINNPLTRVLGRVGLYSVNPTLMGLDYRTAMQLKGVYDTATEEVDEEDLKFQNGGSVGVGSMFVRKR